MSSVGALANRVHDIIRRMGDNIAQAEATKTCYGILAIMSREESSKVIIAKNGMDLILSGMQTHMDKPDVQEAGCDLIWSLAFNNSAVKEMIGNVNGTSVVVRALKRHHKSPEFLKSACGALSNLCQYKVNQQGVASHGGLQPLIVSISFHQENSKLLPFIFDALASLIVGNEENARIVSSQDGISKILAATGMHREVSEVVKSGCHALAILSDVKGQASKIAAAGGVGAILPLLDMHPSYADFHRVAAVVLLRMLQESSHVVREIACNEGIRILLKSLDRGGAQQDTVAAITHILSTVTNPLTAASNSIESQLWVSSGASDIDALSGTMRRGRFPRNDARYVLAADTLVSSGITPGPVKPQHPGSSKKAASEVTALAGLVRLMGQYCERKDVARASCRLLTNLMGFPGVVMALDKISLMDKVLECVHIHRSTKEITEAAAALLKCIHKRTFPAFSGAKLSAISGLLHLIRTKISDEEVVVASLEILCRLREGESHRSRAGGGAPQTTCPSSQWENETVIVCSSVLEAIASGSSRYGNELGSPTNKSSDVKAIPWSKSTPKLLSTVLEFLESVDSSKKADNRFVYPQSLGVALKGVYAILPLRSADLSARIQRLLPSIQANTLEDNTRTEEPPDQDDSSPANFSRRKLLNTTNTLDDSVDKLVKSRSGAAVGGSESGGGSSSSSRTDTGGSTKGYASTKGNRNSPDNTSEGEPVNGTRGVTRESRFPEPLHPLKYCPMPTSDDIRQVIPRLLDTYPSHMEMLATDSGPNRNSTGINEFGSSDSSCRDSNRDDCGVPSRMHLVYEGASAAGKGLASRCPTPVPYNVPPSGLGPPFEHSLTFDSEFESGNLLRAVQKGDYEYDLCLRSDLHTPGHTQWFYFAVSNTHNPACVAAAKDKGVPVAPVKVRFNIVNLTKPDSLFNQGMKPVVYSCNSASSKGQSWIRSGSRISYFGNTFTRNNSAGEGVACYFTLTFTLEFNDPTDTCLIAYSVPYTYTDHKAHLHELLNKPNAKDIIRYSRLCQTLSGADCDLVVITNFKDRENIGSVYNTPLSGKSSNPPENQSGRKLKSQAKLNRKALIISGRVHPGETPASWMMKGTLDFLTSDAPNARLIRQAYIVYIVPMLNPDGVIFGNNRCGLAGVDLNRQWKNPIRSMHPTVYALKTLIQEQKSQREISMYIDLHGHSRKYNIFMYGVEEKKRPNPKVRAFPKFFSLHAVGKKYVSYNDCSFHVRKGREATARVVVARELGIPLSYTVEATFCGADEGPLKFCHMNIGHLQEVGSSMCDAFLQYSIAEGDVPDSLLAMSRRLRSESVPTDALTAAVNEQVRRGGGRSSDKNRSKGSGYAMLKNSTVHAEAEASVDVPSDGGESLTAGKATPGETPPPIESPDNVDQVVSRAESESDIVGDDDSDDGDSVVQAGTDGDGPYVMPSTASSSRSIQSAASSRNSSSMLRSQEHSNRSETAPMNSPALADAQTPGGLRLLARDDGFSFSDSVTANRMIIGIAAKSATSSPPIKSSGESRGRSAVSANKSKDAVSLRPKKVSRKGGLKAKRDKIKRHSESVDSDDTFGTDGQGIFGKRFLMVGKEEDDKGTQDGKSRYGTQFSLEDASIASSVGLPKVAK